MPQNLFLNYLRHTEINEYLDSLAASHTDLITVSDCGKSYEGRIIKSVKISFENEKSKENDKSLDSRRKMQAECSLKLRKAKTMGKTQKKFKQEKAKIKSAILIDVCY